MAGCPVKNVTEGASKPGSCKAWLLSNNAGCWSSSQQSTDTGRKEATWHWLPLLRVCELFSDVWTFHSFIVSPQLRIHQKAKLPLPQPSHPITVPHLCSTRPPPTERIHIPTVCTIISCMRGAREQLWPFTKSNRPSRRCCFFGSSANPPVHENNVFFANHRCSLPPEPCL